MARDDPGIVGYPDGSASRSVLGDYREDFHFAKPARANITLSGTTDNPTGEQYDQFFNSNITLLFLQPPLLQNVIIVRIYKDTPTSFRVSAFDDQKKLTFAFPHYRAYNEDGTYNKSKPIAYLESLIKLTNINRHAESSMGYRLVARGNTFIYTVPKLEEQGFVTSAQFTAPMVQCYDRKDVISSASLDPIGPKLNTEVTSVAAQATWGMRVTNISPSTLVECFHNAYTSKAVDGAYVPIYNSGRDIKYQMDYDRNVQFVHSQSDDPGHLENWFEGDMKIIDTALDGWNMSVTWFEDVSPNCSIKIKHRSVLQLIPAPGSEIANFTRQEPDDDELALETAFRARNKMSHAYPSCYNDWGWLGTFIDNTLSSLPYVGKLYDNVKPLIKPSWDWLGDRAKDWLGAKINLGQI